MKRRAVKKDPKLNTPGSVLARLKDKLLIEMGIDYARLLTLVDNYVVQQNGGIVNTKTHTLRTNTIDELNRPEMTIKVFINKFLAILRANDIKISITIKTKCGAEVVVHEGIVLRDEESFTLEQLKEKDEEEKEGTVTTKEKEEATSKPESDKKS